MMLLINWSVHVHVCSCAGARMLLCIWRLFNSGQVCVIIVGFRMLQYWIEQCPASK